MANKNSLRNAAFNQATIKQTIETQLPKKNGSERVNLTLKSEEKSLKDSISANESARKSPLGRSSLDESDGNSTPEDYEYSESKILDEAKQKDLDSEYVPLESDGGFMKDLQTREGSKKAQNSKPENPLVKKTFGYKVTFFKSPDSRGMFDQIFQGSRGIY